MITSLTVPPSLYFEESLKQEPFHLIVSMHDEDLTIKPRLKQAYEENDSKSVSDCLTKLFHSAVKRAVEDGEADTLEDAQDFLGCSFHNTYDGLIFNHG